jgi:hypothetical protein
MNPERSKNYPLRRRAVVTELLAQRGDALVVAGLGAPAWDVTAADAFWLSPVMVRCLWGSVRLRR